MRDVEVEIIAARTAHPTRAAIDGLIEVTAVMRTLAPGRIVRPDVFARTPKVIGTMQMSIVQRLAPRAALDTVRGESPAKQR